MNANHLKQLTIHRDDKRRSPIVVLAILLFVLGATAAAILFAKPWVKDKPRTIASTVPGADESSGSATTGVGSLDSAVTALPPAQDDPSGPLLTVSGYIINRERIELSPRFMGVVKWIGVQKGDAVTNGQVVALLDDAEYRAQLRQTEARFEKAQVAVEQAELDYQRAKELVASSVEMQKVLDDARLQRATAGAAVKEVQGQLDLIRTYLNWTVIRSPIDGVVLEKLVDPNELVTPQSFGGVRGPSTALISVADPKDLQVEIDLSELDVSKAFLKQRCTVSPEAYPDRVYEGEVVEIAPEANRQKGTLQVKVQIRNPDAYLTPELSARVDFLPRPAGASQ